MKYFCITKAKDLALPDRACIAKLLTEFAGRPIVLTVSEVNSFFRSGLLFMAEDTDLPRGESIIGVGSLVIKNLLTGRSARIEDVFLLEQYRGRGIGRELVQHMIDEARSLGVRHIDLTSRPERAAANKLYVQLGFEKGVTNVYRLDLRR